MLMQMRYLVEGEILREQFEQSCKTNLMMARNSWRSKLEIICRDLTDIETFSRINPTNEFPNFSDSQKRETQQKITEINENCLLIEKFFDEIIETDFYEIEKSDLQEKLWRALGELLSVAYDLGKLHTQPYRQFEFHNWVKKKRNVNKTNEELKEQARGWSEPLLQRAIEIRINKPTIAQENLANELFDECKPTKISKKGKITYITVRTIINKISEWEKSGDLQKNFRKPLAVVLDKPKNV
jgi:hypothetical protein